MRALTVSDTHCVYVVVTDDFTDVLINVLRVPPDIWGIGELTTVCVVCACGVCMWCVHVVCACGVCMCVCMCVCVYMCVCLCGVCVK